MKETNKYALRPDVAKKTVLRGIKKYLKSEGLEKAFSSDQPRNSQVKLLKVSKPQVSLRLTKLSKALMKDERNKPGVKIGKVVQSFK